MATIIALSDQKSAVKNHNTCTTVDDDNADVDRISQLPAEIIHHILSFLPTTDAVGVSVLSKVWYGLFNSFPMSDFSGPIFGGKENLLRFLVFVRNSLLRRCQQNTVIQKFRLSLICPTRCDEITNLIGHCTQLAAQHGVKELDLEFGFYLNLPLAIFSAKELVVCRLSYCSLFHNFPEEAYVCWPSVRELYLKRVHVPDQSSMDNLISNCPSMEKFSLTLVSGHSKLEYLRFFGFTNLKEVEVINSHIEKIEIDALSLQTFSFSDHSKENRETQINLMDCNNLEVLKLHSDTIPDWVSEDLTSIFPSLRVLVIVSSQQLGKLQLYSDSMAEAIIDTPRLQSLKYALRKLPSVFSLNQKSLEKVTLKLFLEDIYSEYSFPKLGEFLGNFNRVKHLTLQIGNCGSVFSVIRKIGRNVHKPPLIDINRLLLKVNLNYRDQTVMAHEALVDGFLWICHPERLFLESGWGTNKEFMKVLCNKIINRDRRCNYAATYNKCPLQGLKGTLIDHYGFGYTKTLTCFDLLRYLRGVAPPQGMICFRFQW